MTTVLSMGPCLSPPEVEVQWVVRCPTLSLLSPVSEGKTRGKNVRRP